MKHDLHVENIKCSGCAHSIVTSLSKVKGVHQVTVDVENGSIQLDMDEVSTLEAVIEKLHHMGYPLPGKGSGMTTASSYIRKTIVAITLSENLLFLVTIQALIPFESNFNIFSK